MPARVIQDPPIEQHLTVREFCETFRVSKSKVHRHIQAGDIAVVDVALSGDKIQPRIPISEVQRWAASRGIPARAQ
jgi:excisionase family DNA binding protein